MPRSWDTPLVRYASDFGHAPLFAGVFFCLRPLAGRLRRPDLAAAVLASLAGALAEVAQGLTWRDASWDDLGADLVGVAVAWAGVACWRRGVAWRLAHGALVVSLAGVAAALVAREAATLRELAAMMPVIAGFEHEWELERWHAKAGTRASRTREGALEGAWSLAVRCTPGGYPGVAVEDFAGDWRGYRWLEWSVGADEPLELVVRIDDDLGAAYGDRYSTVVRVVPGRSGYRVDLREVAARFPSHPMDMDRITEVHFFLDEPERPRFFLLDAVRLVREDGAVAAGEPRDSAGQTR